eukprot:684737-Hanusia_phi.AAC.2
MLLEPRKAKIARAMADSHGKSVIRSGKDRQQEGQAEGTGGVWSKQRGSRHVQISEAKLEVAEELVQLVNWAYQGKQGREGWTGVTLFIDGFRIDMSGMLKALADPKTTILAAFCHEWGHRPVGCIKVEAGAGDVAEIGMFAVDPDLQSKRIGSSLLRAAEEFARDVLKAKQTTMFVLDNRSDILSWYSRWGYEQTEETVKLTCRELAVLRSCEAPFPEDDQSMGRPKMKLRFVKLNKLSDFSSPGLRRLRRPGSWSAEASCSGQEFDSGEPRVRAPGHSDVRSPRTLAHASLDAGPSEAVDSQAYYGKDRMQGKRRVIGMKVRRGSRGREEEEEEERQQQRQKQRQQQMQQQRQKEEQEQEQEQEQQEQQEQHVDLVLTTTIVTVAIVMIEMRSY